MNKSIFRFLILVAILGTGAYFYLQQSGEVPELSNRLPVNPVPAPPAEPEIRYPIPERNEAYEVEAVPPAMDVVEPDGAATTSAAPATEEVAIESLPALEDSDPVMMNALSGLIGEQVLAELFNSGDLIRHMVVTIDNAPREKMPEKLRPVKPAEGPFLIQGDQDQPVLSPENYRRYAPYVALAASLDVERLTDLYIHYYPLFQEAYLDLGYPSGYFNDRLVEVIDRLLETPELEGPVRLVRPHVLYQYADPELEALSAGQKVLLRMGPENARRIKIRLREIRQRVTRFAPAEY